MDLKWKNLVAVMTVLVLLIGGVITYYFTVGVGAITTGKVVEVGNSAALNLSNTSTATLDSIETSFGSNVSTANAVIPIVFGLIALVSIILIFGFKFNMGTSGKEGAN